MKNKFTSKKKNFPGNKRYNIIYIIPFSYDTLNARKRNTTGGDVEAEDDEEEGEDDEDDDDDSFAFQHSEEIESSNRTNKLG